MFVEEKKNTTLPPPQLKAPQKHLKISVLLPVTFRYASSPVLCLSQHVTLHKNGLLDVEIS